MRTLSMVILCIMFGIACTQDDGGVADFSAGMKAYESKNYKEALKWWTKAAEKNHVDAQFNLGVLYANGQGMEHPNYQEALKWWTKAAEKDHVDALNELNNLGVQYQMAQDYQKALECYTVAAKKGNALAQNNMAKMYFEGRGVEPNFRNSERLWLLAAQQGDSIIIEHFISILRFKISEDELEYWNKLKNKEIDNWKPKKLDGSGSGFYITKEYILTNAHVVCSNYPDDSCEPYDEVRTPYYRLDVDTTKIDIDVDLALLKVVS